VSTDEQAPLDERRAAGCDAVQEEYASGTDRARPLPARLLLEISPGETLVVVRPPSPLGQASARCHRHDSVWDRRLRIPDDHGDVGSLALHVLSCGSSHSAASI
jgi:hypothetical protein